MITGWRADLQNPDLWFGFIQIAGYKYGNSLQAGDLRQVIVQPCVCQPAHSSRSQQLDYSGTLLVFVGGGGVINGANIREAMTHLPQCTFEPEQPLRDLQEVAGFGFCHSKIQHIPFMQPCVLVRHKEWRPQQQYPGSNTFAFLAEYMQQLREKGLQLASMRVLVIVMLFGLFFNCAG